MQKKSKSILAAVVMALFVLSVSYFALLAPTTAWYIQEDNKDYSFTFGNFHMDEGETEQVTTTNIDLRGTTRFADKGEILFDEMVHVIKVEAENTGELDGIVNVEVSQTTTSGGDTTTTVLRENAVSNDSDYSHGLKWFVFSTGEEPAVSLGSAQQNTLKIVNTSAESATVSLELTAATATTITDNDGTTTINLSVGTNTISNIAINSGASYSFSNLPDDMKYKLTITSETGVRVVSGTGGLKETTGRVPHAGAIVELGTSYKAAIDKMLKDANTDTSVTWPLDYKNLPSTLSGATDEAKYETYNNHNNNKTGAIDKLKEHNDQGVIVEPGSANKKIVYVVFWAEYGELKSSTDFNVDAAAASRSAVTQTYNNITIKFKATPEVLSQRQTLQITNSVNAAKTVKLYVDGAAYASTYDSVSGGQTTQATASAGTLTVPASGSVSVMLQVGTYYRLEITGENPGVEFSTSTTGGTALGSQTAGVISNDVTTSYALVVPNS